MDSLRARLLVAFLAVVVASLGTVGLAMLFVGPGYFTDAIGHLPGDPMSAAMDSLAGTAFAHALLKAIGAATLAAVLTATIVSLAVAGRIARPISALARAAGRVAGGHYGERVPAGEPGELGELAASFNEMAGSLEETEARRLRLVGDVAHELRTPLATLDGYLEGLEDGVIAPAAPTWHLLRTETGRLTRMVNDLSELWRAEDGRLALHIDAVDAASVVASVVEQARPLAASRDIAVVLDVHHVLALGDADRLAQIVANYLSNALRYAPTGSAIVTHVASSGSRVRISLADEGPGLDSSQLDAVFERFYRVDAARSRAAGGSGIGLAIARALSEAMGGRAWAESPGLGRGSTFFVELPAA